MDNRPIGVFDSGIGGLTVVKEIKKQMPKENIVYLGDTARVPYGTRSEEIITKFALQCVDFIEKQNIKALIIACNTVSAVALEKIKEKVKVNTIGVINAGSIVANKTTKNNKIGIIGTKATVNNGAYEKKIKEENINNKVYSKSCPLFVPIVEEGLSKSVIAEETIKYYMEDITKKGIDTIVMGCTHYPILEETIKKVIGNEIELVNPAKETVKEMYNYLEEKNMLSVKKEEDLYYVTDDEKQFENNLTKFIEISKPKIIKIELK